MSLEGCGMLDHPLSRVMTSLDVASLCASLGSIHLPFPAHPIGIAQMPAQNLAGGGCCEADILSQRHFAIYLRDDIGLEHATQSSVIARSVATKQSTLPSRRYGLLRFARNDGDGSPPCSAVLFVLRLDRIAGSGPVGVGPVAQLIKVSASGQRLAAIHRDGLAVDPVAAAGN